MSKYNPSPLSGDLAPVNAELDKIASAIDDQYDRVPDVGVDNQLTGDLDANSNRVLNLPQPQNANEAARLKDVQEATTTGLPDQTGNAGKYLQTDGSVVTWEDVPTPTIPVDSVFGRTGDVVAAASDYDAVQIDYDNSTSGLSATNTQDAIDEVVAAAPSFVIKTGEVDSSGNPVYLPTGWSVTRPLTGRYNFTIPAEPDTNYSVVVTSSTGTVLQNCGVDAKTTTSFTVVIMGTGGSLNSQFNFIFARG